MIEVTAKPTFEPNATPASRAHCKFAPGESSTWHLSKDKRGRRWNINEIPPNTKAKMLIGWRSRFHPASLENAPQNAPRPLDAGREREEKEHARCSHLDHSFLSSRHQSVIRIVPAKRNLHHHHQISDQKIIRTYPTVIIQRLPDNDYIYPETPASTGPGKALLLLLLLLLHVLQPTRSQHWPSLTGYRTPGGERGATEGGRWSIDRFLTTVVHQGRLEVGKKAIFITREKLRKLGTWGRLSLWTSTLFLRPIFLLRCCYTYGTHVHYVISFRGGKKERKRERKQGRGTHSLERTGGRNTVGYHGELVATLCTGGGRGGHASLVRFVKPAKEKTHASRRLDVDWGDDGSAPRRVRTPLLSPHSATLGGATDALPTPSGSSLARSISYVCSLPCCCCCCVVPTASPSLSARVYACIE